MAKKPIETKETKEKILSLIPARTDLIINFNQVVAGVEGAPDTVSTVSRHAVALALCENEGGDQYVRALTAEDLTAFGFDGLTFVSATI